MKELLQTYRSHPAYRGLTIETVVTIMPSIPTMARMRIIVRCCGDMIGSPTGLCVREEGCIAISPYSMQSSEGKTQSHWS
jgi:hypothetical protein